MILLLGRYKEKRLFLYKFSQLAYTPATSYLTSTITMQNGLQESCNLRYSPATEA